MSRDAWISPGLVVAAVLATVANLVTNDGLWWRLSLVLAAPVVAVVIESLRDRSSQPAGDSNQGISLSSGKRILPPLTETRRVPASRGVGTGRLTPDGAGGLVMSVTVRR